MSTNGLVCFDATENLNQLLQTQDDHTFVLVKTGSGIEVRQPDGVMLWSFPLEFPVGKLVHCIDWDKKHGILYVNYKSVWPEFVSMCYGSSVVLIHQGVPQGLPDVQPDTVLYTSSCEKQILIGQVEKSPFGVPCAALLPLDKVQSKVGDLSSLFIFPKDEPLIVEGFATTTGFERIHQTVNIPGTGACYGDVPHVYAWVSPDHKRHGWALTLIGQWESVGKKRPKKWKMDRSILYDPIWYDNGDECYTIMLGGRTISFPSLSIDVNGETTRFKIERLMHDSSPT